MCSSDLPEIGLSVIDLDLIREIRFDDPDEAEVRMVLTTPFCPYGPMLINQIQSAAELAAETAVKVRSEERRVGKECRSRWSPGRCQARAPRRSRPTRCPRA